MLTAVKPLVTRFDTAVERRVERRRGHPMLDRVMYTASDLGEFSLIWHLIGTGRALAPDRTPAHAVRLAALLGAESLLVNQGVKRLFGRRRPLREEPHRFRLRQPITSSFPSGHASSAAFAATVLAERDPLWPLYAAVAATVATSRVYVKLHHPSDVAAGAALGVALGLLARRAWPAHRAGTIPGGMSAARPGVDRHHDQFRRQLGLPLPIRPQRA
jgi:membrane-associated phospholipid phosphatase